MAAASSPSPRVLLLGGHGKISLLLTPLLLARSWHVTSVIRNPSHKEEILKLGEGQKGKIDVLVDSLDDVKSDSDARRVLDSVKPDYVVWSAGAGGKGNPSRTFAIDRDACKTYIRTSLTTPSIKKFLLISYFGSRRNRPHWWTDSDWATAQHVNNNVLANYFKAKVDADEYLTAMAHKRQINGDEKFQSIILRPGTLTDERATGKVRLGHTGAKGSVSRADVADVAARLLERGDTRGWLDLMEGETEAGKAVEEVVRDGVDCFEGEDEERIWGLAD